MSRYIVQDITDGEYAALILGTSFEGVFKYISDIEHLLKDKQKHGWIVLDSLLKTGINPNRFCSVYFDGENIHSNTARNLSLPRDSDIRKLSASMLKNHPDLLQYSILTDQQKKLILHGIVI